jgi:hypothetical protein
MGQNYKINSLRRCWSQKVVNRIRTEIITMIWPYKIWIEQGSQKGI